MTIELITITEVFEYTAVYDGSGFGNSISLTWFSSRPRVGEKYVLKTNGFGKIFSIALA